MKKYEYSTSSYLTMYKLSHSVFKQFKYTILPNAKQMQPQY